MKRACPSYLLPFTRSILTVCFTAVFLTPPCIPAWLYSEVGPLLFRAANAAQTLPGPEFCPDAPPARSDARSGTSDALASDPDPLAFWQALLDLLTSDTPASSAQDRLACRGERWTLSAPLRGGHRFKPDAVRWDHLKGIERYQVLLTDLDGSVLWKRSLVPEPSTASSTLTFPSPVWRLLKPDLAYPLRVAAFWPDGRLAAELTVLLWRSSEARWRTFERAVPTLEPGVCQIALQTGLDCASFLSIARGTRALQSNFFAEALHSFGSLSPLEQTAAYARARAAGPSHTPTPVTAEPYSHIVLARAQATTCVVARD